MKITNQELAKKILEGDRNAEVELINRIKQSTLLFVKKNLWDSEHVEDVVNDSFIVIIQNLRLGKIRKLEALSSYIYGVTKNICKNANRAYRSKKTQSIENLLSFEKPNIESSIQKQIENKEMQLALRDCIDDLDRVDNNIVFDSFFENKSNKTIAENLGITQDLVAVRKLRALKKLKECLKNKNYFCNK